MGAERHASSTDDSEGNHGVLYPGLAQRMSAGTRHPPQREEPEPGHARPLHPDVGAAGHQRASSPATSSSTSTSELAKGGLVPIASGQGHEKAITIHQRGAVLWGARLAAGETVALPTDRHVHAFVPIGTATLSTGERLAEGAAARLTDAGAIDLTAGDSGAEILVWATD